MTQYTIQVSMGNLADSGGSLTLYAADGFTDAMVAAIYQALANLTWPQTVRPGGNIGVSKDDQTSTSYTTGYTSNPVTFA
jgi:hypothetical protein